MRFHASLLFAFLLCCQLPASGFQADEAEGLEKSAYFAYVDRDYIFTIEVVSPGTPLLNFVSMTDREDNLQAKNITLSFGNRQAAVKLFSIRGLHLDLGWKAVSEKPRSFMEQKLNSGKKYSNWCHYLNLILKPWF
jgi:hypothetical protein